MRLADVFQYIGETFSMLRDWAMSSREQLAAASKGIRGRIDWTQETAGWMQAAMPLWR